MNGTTAGSELHIRPRESGDLARAAAALVAVHEADGYPVEGVEEPEKWLSPPGLSAAWVAELSGRVVGHVAVSKTEGGGGGVLERLFVLPEARRHRAGEGLVRTAEAYARARNLALELEVLTKDEAAIRLYKRLGWSETGRRTHQLRTGDFHPALTFTAP
ncbi:GNAT family N-acetyltransferase [Streptomyces rubiginosohelvolus]|uniref:GNAT family N-acetyltransferase n=1 Tax=Streptomyces TaxID=1883 RepID=UPI0022789A22|nr:GNAT family N-acetyltransferase [Streptomyces cavourensis]WAE68460.1 GNAT family N-acetyltransferase [Streptomyces cavourensis]